MVVPGIIEKGYRELKLAEERREKGVRVRVG